MTFKNILPILEWLPNYKKSWLKGDVVAGITVGVMLIPQGIAYAMIVGIPVIYGLYTALIPQIMYAIFGTSRQLAVGPSAISSLIVGAGVLTLAEVGTNHFLEFAILLALITGGLQILFGIFRLGFLVNFLSKPVISGFTSAAALIVALNQLKYLLGVDISRHSNVQDSVIDTARVITQLDWLTLSFGVGAVAIIILFKKYIKKMPATLVVVAVGIVLAKFLNLDHSSLTLVGEIPRGLPEFRVPVFTQEIVVKLFPIALTLAFVGFLEAISVSKVIEAKHNDYKINPNKEFLALGLGNVVGAFFQAYPATGGLSRTAVNDQTGARTPLSSFVAAFIVAMILLFFTPVFYYLPKAVLGAIIIVGVSSLLDFSMPKQLFKYSKKDLIILIVTLITTATIGIKEGVSVGVVLSLIMLIYKSTKPHIAILGRVPGTHFYRNKERFDEVEIDDEILIVRFDSQLFFANANYFKDKIYEYANDKGADLKLLIIDGQSISSVDGSAIYTLFEMLEYFNKRDIKFVFTGLRGPVRDTMIKSGFMKTEDYNMFFMSVHVAIQWFNTGFSKNKFTEYVKQNN